MKIPFIKYSKFWFIISGLLVIVSIAALSMWKLKLGIDFTGGSLMEVSFSKRPTIESFQSTLEKSNIKDAVVQASGDAKYLVRSRFLSEDEHQSVLKNIQASYAVNGSGVQEERFETIGSSVSAQLRTRAIWAIIIVNIAIIIYIAYAFRKVSRPVASWKYGALAIVALVHDVLVVLGAFAFLGHFFGVEVGIDFVVALLTVLGFSVTDTIVVYDRVRENLVRTGSEHFDETVNHGLNDTLMRSINTTLTVLLPLFALYYFGGASIHSFTLALLIGMASGAYSSIFIASPLLVTVQRFQDRRLAQ